jgi:D-amino-acid dehydrogenase
LTMGPLAGRLLADLVTGQRALMDLSPFNPGRRAVPTAALCALR